MTNPAFWACKCSLPITGTEKLKNGATSGEGEFNQRNVKTGVPSSFVAQGLSSRKGFRRAMAFVAQWRLKSIDGLKIFKRLDKGAR